MSLIAKEISDILIEARDTLQDQQKTRWPDQELFRYLDQASRDIAIQTKYLRIQEDITIGSGRAATTGDITLYTLTHEALEFYEIDCDQTYEIQDARTLYMEDNEDEDISVDYYAFPARIAYGADTTLYREEDQYDAIRYFILYRSYQKEDAIESIQKAEYFRKEYMRILNSNMKRWNGDLNWTPSKSDFYT